jgi:hypothetical protein
MSLDYTTLESCKHTGGREMGDRELAEENAKLKGIVFALRGHMEISSWTNKEQRLAQMNLELEEENAKLKEEFADYQKWARNCCDLLEDKNARLNEKFCGGWGDGLP